ncbi:WD40 repeat-like protein [Aspergillus sclerotioniger CBS 115572]|uniref:WD40 repeat-like protein n=1 Tax=Aspergillus sclerotioniger CBS 115572 TaxID=1450535 RepID=A0A317W2D8_9EURO|nr:WD40 repeat-like protein [Aspergillus sclerotioniger CBS 115572]PWY79407.1 WD40 repeat-like protein [Aspergillus sclerotioniger CBS 115572]
MKKKKASKTSIGTHNTPEFRKEIAPDTIVHNLGEESIKVQLQGPATALALSPDDRLIAVAVGGEIHIYYWSGAASKGTEIVHKHLGTMKELVFAPNLTVSGGYLLVSSADCVKVWDIDNEGRVLDPAGGFRVDPAKLSTEAAGDLVAKLVHDHGLEKDEDACLSIDGDLRELLSKAVDKHTHEHQIVLKGNMAIFSPDGKFMICITRDKKFEKQVDLGPSPNIITWDDEKRESQRELPGHSGGVRWAAVSPDSKSIASVERDDKVRIWNAASGTCDYILDLSGETVLRGALSPNPKHIALITTTGLFVYEITTGNHTILWKLPNPTITFVTWSPNGRLIATLSADGFGLRNAITGVQRMQHPGPVLRNKEKFPIPLHMSFVDEGKRFMFNCPIDMATVVYDFMSLVRHKFPREISGTVGPVCSKDATVFLNIDNGQTLRLWTFD